MCIHEAFYFLEVTYWYCLVFSRPMGSSYIHYAESSMKNGFGLKYLHRFFNIPFLQLQVAFEPFLSTRSCSFRHWFLTCVYVFCGYRERRSSGSWRPTSWTWMPLWRNSLSSRRLKIKTMRCTVSAFSFYWFCNFSFSGQNIIKLFS